MSKRGNGEGSITKRTDGRWMGRVTVPGSGRKTVYGKTRKEVAEEIAKMLGDVRQGLPLGDKTTVSEFLTRWLEDSVKSRVRRRTYEGYRQIVRDHLEPTLGNIRLSKFAPADLQRLYAAKFRQGLSPTTVIHIHACLHRALEQAMRWGMVARNVAALVDRPKESRHRFNALSAEEAFQLLDEANGTRLEALFVLAVTTGMRQGEILGLRWQDVDLEIGRLSVRQTLSMRGGEIRFDAPKTQGSARSINLSSRAVRVLRTHRAQQNEERLACGPKWQDSGLVFTTTTGRPIAPWILVESEFKPLLREAGLRMIRFHDLRHTAASLLLSENVHPKKVQELLGHSTITLTMNTYSHILPTTQDEIAEHMDRLFDAG